jgi:hypothetical protein
MSEDPFVKPVPNPEAELPCDLAERLARYRARLQSEGRKSGIDQLDRAIREARGDRKAPPRR